MTILATQSIAAANIRMKFEETYTSESVNRATIAAQARGINFGYRLVPDTGANASVRLERDPVLNRSMAVIVDESQNLALSIQETSDVTFDLAAFAGQRVFIYAFIDYSVASATTGEFRIVDSAELLSGSWFDRAISLGSVRVPAAGSITVDHIDSARAEYAGIEKGISGWTQLNENPKFNQGLVGYLVDWPGSTALGDGEVEPILEEDDLGRTQALRLGTALLTEPIMESRLEIPITDFDVNDLILVRTKLKTNGILGVGVSIKAKIYGWGLGVEDQLLFEVELTSQAREGTIADYEEYGFSFLVSDTPAGGGSVNLDIDQIVIYLQVENPANIAGQYDVSELYAYRRRLSGGSSNNQPMVKAPRAVEFGEVAGGLPGTVAPRIYAESGTLKYSDANTTAPVAMSDAGATEPLTSSLLRDAARGSSVTEVASGLFPYMVINGLEVSHSLLDIFAITAGSIYVDDSVIGQRRRDILGATLNIAGIDALVFVNLTNDAIEFDTLTNIAALPNGLNDKVPLAVVRNTVTPLVSPVAIRPVSMLASVPVVTLGTVPPSNPADIVAVAQKPMFTRAQSACDYLRAYYKDSPFGAASQNAPAIIQIVGLFELETGDQFDLEGIGSVVIQGVGDNGSVIQVNGMPAGATIDTSRFITNSTLTVKDLRITSNGVNVTDSALFYCSSPGDVTLINVDTTRNAVQTWDHFFYSAGGDLQAIDCSWAGRTLFFDSGFGLGQIKLERVIFQAVNTLQGEHILQGLVGNGVIIVDSTIDGQRLTTTRGAGLRGSLGVELAGVTKVRGLTLLSCPLTMSDSSDMDIRDLRFALVNNDPYQTLLTLDTCRGIVDGVRLDTGVVFPEAGTIIDALIEINGKSADVSDQVIVKNLIIRMNGNFPVETLVALADDNILLDGGNINVESFTGTGAEIFFVQGSATYTAITGMIIVCDDASSPGIVAQVNGDLNRLSNMTLTGFDNPIIQLTGDDCLVDMLVNNANGGSTVNDTGSGNIVGSSIVNA